MWGLRERNVGLGIYVNYRECEFGVYISFHKCEI